MRYLIPLLLLFSTSSLSGQTPNTVDISELVIPNDTCFFYKRTMDPYTGTVTCKWGVMGELVNGKQLNSTWRVWYENGQLKQETNWTNGQLDGLSRFWYDNGQFWQEVNWTKGQLDGLSRVWTLSGVLIMDVLYDNGKLIKETK